MHQVFSLCKAFDARVLTTDMMSKRWCQSLGFLGIPRHQKEMTFCFLRLLREISSHWRHQCQLSHQRSQQDDFTSPNVIWTNLATQLVVSPVMPLESAREALEFITLQLAEKGWNFCFKQKRAPESSPTYIRPRLILKSLVRNKKCPRKAQRSFMDIQVRDHKESLKVSRSLRALTGMQGISRVLCQKVPVGITSGGESPESSRQETWSSLNQ